MLTRATSQDSCIECKQWIQLDVQALTPTNIKQDLARAVGCCTNATVTNYRNTV